MDEIFLALLQKIADEVQELREVDMDWGQLETQEETYPIDFPCCLIDISNVAWEQTGVPFQTGLATVKLKIAVNMLDDTHFSGGKFQNAVNRLAVVKSVHNTVNLFRDEGFSKLVRSNTRRYNMPGGIKVTELEYETAISEISNSGVVGSGVWNDQSKWDDKSSWKDSA